MTDSPSVLSLITSSVVLVALVGAVVKWLLNRKPSAAKAALVQAEKDGTIAETVAALLATADKQIRRMDRRIDGLDKAVVVCEDSRRQLITELEELRGRIAITKGPR